MTNRLCPTSTHRRSGAPDAALIERRALERHAVTSRAIRHAALTMIVVSALLAGGRVTQAQTPSRPAAQPAAAPAVDLRERIPFDATVRTGTLPNGLRFFVRRNPRPANRIALRLAVKAGSLFEADDQQGLAHLIEHMAFNGSEHFKPGELVSYFESTGSRLGPHVNAYTSFDETVYMLDLPTDSKEIVSKGLTAMADFAGGLALDPEQIDKERGVVIEEWRGGPRARTRPPQPQPPARYLRSTPSRSTRSAALSSRSGGDASAPARASSSSSCRCSITARATPCACRSASRRFSAPRRRRGCARSTTPGIARSASPSSRSATPTRRKSRRASERRSVRCAIARRRRRCPIRPCRSTASRSPTSRPIRKSRSRACS